MMESEVLAERLYRTYADAAIPAETGDGFLRSGSIPPGWLRLTWEKRQRWRAVADEVIRLRSTTPVEDYHGRANGD